MSYCTLDQLTDRYSNALLVEISDRADAPTGTIDADMIARAISDADALIDGYLARRYKLPLSSTPRLVTDLSLRISIYYAHGRVAAEKITKDYEAALKTLRDIAGGLITIDVDGVEPAASGAGEIRTNDPHRPFTADSMKGFI